MLQKFLLWDVIFRTKCISGDDTFSLKYIYCFAAIQLVEGLEKGDWRNSRKLSFLCLLSPEGNCSLKEQMEPLANEKKEMEHLPFERDYLFCSWKAFAVDYLVYTWFVYLRLSLGAWLFLSSFFLRTPLLGKDKVKYEMFRHLRCQMLFVSCYSVYVISL